MNDLSEKIFSKIKEEKITPRPRWLFLFRRFTIWLAFIFSTLLGSAAMSAVFFVIKNWDWDIYNYLGVNFYYHLFSGLPYFWIAFMVFFLWLAYYNARNTEKGYKLDGYYLAFFSVLLSLLGGATLAYREAGHAIDNYVSVVAPFYGGYDNANKKMWNNPQFGLLGGEIVKVKSPEEIFVSCGNDEWSVMLNGTSTFYNQIKTEMSTGTVIKVIGESCGEKCFNAAEIRPWSAEDFDKKKEDMVW